MSTKRTYQPKKRARRNKHGYLARASSPGGRDVMRRRQAKGRERLVPV